MLYPSITFAAEKWAYAPAEGETTILARLKWLPICWLGSLLAVVAVIKEFIPAFVAEVVSTGAFHMVAACCFLYESPALGALAVTQNSPKILQLGILAGALVIRKHALVAVDRLTLVASGVRGRVLFFLCIVEMLQINETLAWLFRAHSYVGLFEDFLVSFELAIFLYDLVWQGFEALTILVDGFRAVPIRTGNGLEPAYFVNDILVKTIGTKLMPAFGYSLFLGL